MTGSDADVIIVVGVGSAQMEPDRVRAIVGVSVVASTVGEALTAAADAQARLVAVLTADGVRSTSIQTVAYGVGRDRGGDRLSSRHRADVSMRVLLPDVPTAGEIIARAAEAIGDGFRVHGLWPDVADREPAHRSARADAVGAARRQAEELAAAGGVRVGSLRSLVESCAAVPIGLARPPTLAATSSVTPDADGGELAVSIAVTATYEIEH